jgi:energy-coupling factor transport system permease protein
MLNYLGRYFPADSFWHHADPRCKLAVVVMLFTLLIAGSGITLWAPLGMMLILYRTARLPWCTAIAILKQFKWLIAITFIANWWSFGLQLGAGAALTTTLDICIKLTMALLMATWLCLVTKPFELIDAWAKLLKPLGRLGLPVEDWALFLGLVLRFTAEIGRETGQIIMAQRLRGIKPGAAWRQGGLWIRSTLIPVFLAALRQAKTVATALELRGYRRGQARSAWRQLRFTKSDWVITLSCLLGILYIFVRMWLTR